MQYPSVPCHIYNFFFLTRYCRWMLFARFHFRQLHSLWKTTAHLGCELNYDLNTLPLLNFLNLFPSCASDSFLTLRNYLLLGLFFLCKSKIQGTFLIQVYLLAYKVSWVQNVHFSYLVARHSLNHSQYHHVNPFTVVRLYSWERSPCGV